MNDMGAVRSTMEPFRVLARESNAVVVVTAHSPKVQADPGDSLAGSHQLAAVVDGLIHLRRSPQLQKHERELHFVGRDWPEIEPQVVALDPATLTWRPQGALSDVRDAAKDAQRQQDAGFGQIGHRVRSMVNTVSGHREHHLGAWWPGVGAERRRACVSLAYDPVSLQIHLLSFQSCTFTAASAFCAWTRP
jgi:hypothetical protein